MIEVLPYILVSLFSIFVIWALLKFVFSKKTVVFLSISSALVIWWLLYAKYIALVFIDESEKFSSIEILIQDVSTPIELVLFIKYLGWQAGILYFAILWLIAKSIHRITRRLSAGTPKSGAP